MGGSEGYPGALSSWVLARLVRSRAVRLRAHNLKDIQEVEDGYDGEVAGRDLRVDGGGGKPNEVRQRES